MCLTMQEASTKRSFARSYSRSNVTIYFMSIHRMQSSFSCRKQVELTFISSSFQLEEPYGGTVL
jgi:hypothetical protein